MNENVFELTLRDESPKRIVVHFNGFVNAQFENHLEEYISQIPADSNKEVLIDFSKVEGIDASGLVQLTIFLTKVGRKVDVLLVRGLSESTQAVFDMAHLNDLLHPYEEGPRELIAPIGTSQNSQGTENKQSIKAQWAEPMKYVKCEKAPINLVNLNVDGRQPTSPVQGFGRMWLKTYRIALPGIKQTPGDIITIWKENFPHFWPPSNTIYFYDTNIQPGATGLINLSLPGGLKLATGAVVMYADDRSFSLMTVQGHMFSGWITFSAYEDETVYAQVQALVRPSDPLFELSFRLGLGTKAEDTFWHQTLINLAHHLGAEGDIEQTDQLVDKGLQWQYTRNIWHNAAIRSGIYQIAAPFHRLIGQSSN